jgi:hypothetical protein
MMKFSHIGLITDTPQPGETWVEKTRVWTTDHTLHPFHVEWIRFAPDSPVTGPVRDKPHIAYQVDSIEDSSRGLRVLLEPWSVTGTLRVGCYEHADGTVVEFAEGSRHP